MTNTTTGQASSPTDEQRACAAIAWHVIQRAPSQTMITRLRLQQRAQRKASEHAVRAAHARRGTSPNDVQLFLV